MTTKFTPGPWKVEYLQEGGVKAWEVVGPKPNEWVAECGYGGNSEACARFIAAAPDMYEALRLAYESMTGNNDPFKIDVWEAAVNAVFAALAKADGRSA